MKSRTVSMLLCALAGCATTGRQQQTRRFTGDPYDITEHRNVIAGDVCGLDIDYAVSREGGATVLLGRGVRRLEVRDGYGARHVTGVLNLELGNGFVDLYVSADQLVGQMGPLRVKLTADGDSYRGTYQITDDKRLGEMEIVGRQEILGLPRAELAALLPPMLHCSRRGGFDFVSDRVTRQPVQLRFGGPPHYETLAAGAW